MTKLSDKLRLAAQAYSKYLHYRLTGAKYPIFLTFGVTNRCNLKCRYCFASLQRRKNDELSCDEIIGYLNQFMDIGACQIDLQGGEPTLNEDLGKIIRHVVSRGRACSVATNGLLVKRFLPELKLCYAVCCSLDGAKELVDAVRGAGAYETAVRALDLMSREGIAVRLHGVVNHMTAPSDIDHLCGLARQYRTNVNFVYALDNGEVDTGCGERQGFPDRAKALVSHILELKKRGAPITSKYGACNQVLRWPYAMQEIKMTAQLAPEELRRLRWAGIRPCLWGHLACFFNTDRRIYMCPRGFEREGFYESVAGRPVREAFVALAGRKSCYQCGQMGDLSYSFDLLSRDNLATWLEF